MIGGRLFLAILSAGAIAAACSSDAQTPAAESNEKQAVSAARPLASEPVTGSFGGSDVLEGWLLACDNARVCRAQPRSSGGSLMIRRDPGSNGLLRVVLDGQEPGDPMRPDPASVRLEGLANAAAAHWQLDQESDRMTLEGDAALAFVRTLLGATSLSYDTTEGRLEVHLSGLREALQAMDEAQGHAGGEAAFVSVGPRPRAALPAAPALPIITPAPADPLTQLPAAYAARVRRASERILTGYECDSDRYESDEAWALNATEAIVILACGHGNVSSSYALMRAARTGPPQVRPIALPRVPGEGEDGDSAPIYTDVEWVSPTASIHSSGHSCAGGCGHSSHWVYDGRNFVLASHLVYELGGAEALQLYRSDMRESR